MKLLKTIGLGLLAIIILLLVVALFIPGEVNYERSVTISAPIEEVWENTNSLSDLDKWSPWADYDPNMRLELSGTDGTVGATSNWESEVDKVGKGSQTITKIEAPTLFATDLKFYTPYESEAKGFIKLNEEGDKTKVTWGFESNIPYPFTLMKLTTNMDEAVGKDFDTGLSKLKKLCEQ